MSIITYSDNNKKKSQFGRSDWGERAPISDNAAVTKGAYFNTTRSNSQSRQAKRPTHAQVAANLDISRPTPQLKPTVTQTKLLSDRGNLLAFQDVDLYLGNVRLFMMRGVRIVKQNDGSLYAQLPHQQSKQDNRYYPILCCYDQSLKRNIHQAALEAYNEAISDPVIQLALDFGQGGQS